MFCLLF